ncbi:MAG: hypothetical protein CFE29_31050 [Bradyrhizobiaceae bacterium PARB1]|jgi:hypothetical protein|nr:MAG: hypothetical protein CFE29_31050 [Bradyrhizobiaceae bacterium PARB1]
MSVGLAAGRPVISDEKKTASASESLAHNLAANAANGEETVHAGTMRQHGFIVKRRRDAASAPGNTQGRRISAVFDA